MQQAYQALLAHREDLLCKRNVVGCGLAYKETGGIRTASPCVTVLVEKKVSMLVLGMQDLVPPMLGHVPTDVVEVGRIRLLSNRTGRVRPAVPGISIGHQRVSAGTFGAVVYDNATQEPLILSNNHVLANETTGQDGRAQAGDPIYQPGPYDGGGPGDQIGTLLRFVPLHMPPPRSNLVDAAVAKPLQADLISPTIMGIGQVTGTAEAQVGEQVRKSGRSTGVTTGEVRAVNVTVTVLMSEGRSARFDNQVVCSCMCSGGDSGSLGVTDNNLAFGLLFAGSEVATVFNRIDYVLGQLDVSLSPGTSSTEDEGGTPMMPATK